MRRTNLQLTKGVRSLQPTILGPLPLDAQNLLFGRSQALVHLAHSLGMITASVGKLHVDRGLDQLMLGEDDIIALGETLREF